VRKRKKRKAWIEKSEGKKKRKKKEKKKKEEKKEKKEEEKEKADKKDLIGRIKIPKQEAALDIDLRG